MTTASVSIDRTSLSLPALVISGDGTGTYSLTKNGLGRPAMSVRETRAPASSDLHGGGELLAAVKDESALPLEVLVQADSDAALDQAITDLDDALWQFSYTTTVTVGGVAKVWTCRPAVSQVAGGAVEHAHVSQFFEVLAISIPVYPIPGA